MTGAMEVEERATGSDFGTLLRRYRLAAGLSQEALAKRARMSSDGISALERGHRRTPQRETLALLAGALALRDEDRQELEAAAARPPSPRRGASVTVGPWAAPAVAILPLALTSFVGREAELDQIATLVREHRLVTLTGAGGVGKTQTALQAASRLSDACDVRFIGLAPISDPPLVVAAIASALGVQEVPNRPLLETVLAYLRNKTMLLILDNCEHVVAETANLARALLSGCPRLRLLATSREPLKAAGEYAYRLPSLGVGPAVELFADRARAVDHCFTLSDANASIVAEMCRRLDGIPLAIELAAARVNVLPVRILAERLDDRLRILTGAERTAISRHQTMRATIDWSYELLSSREQRVFECLSIFAGGCTLAAATTVCSGADAAENDVLDLLSSLVDKSLVVADFELGFEPRYRLLESFRQYAREKLAARNEEQTVAGRHANACIQLTERLERAYESEPEEVWRRLAHVELDNYRAALRWALTDRGDVVLGQRLAGLLHMVWRHLAHVEGRGWIRLARQLVDERTPAGVLAALSAARALIAFAYSEDREQLASSETALANYHVLGDSLGIARMQRVKGDALRKLGRVAEAKVVLVEALATARMLGGHRTTVGALASIGSVTADDGDIVAARRYYTEAISIWEAIGGRQNMAGLFNTLAESEFRAGNAELAIQHAKETINPAGRSTEPEPVNNMSAYLTFLGRYDEGYERAREALALAQEEQHECEVAYSLQHIVAAISLGPHDAEEIAANAFARFACILGFVDARLAAIGIGTRVH